MRVGDLVRVIDARVPEPIEVGDVAILLRVDWDHRHYPNGIVDRDGRRITGRGFFLFPDKPAANDRGNGKMGVMLLFESFEVLCVANS